jgi:hypothetical protein
MTKETISTIAEKHLIETENPAVMYGDTHLLDEIANKCTHTNLMTLHPLVRHQRMLNALEKSNLFTKGYVRITGYRGFSLVRSFKLKPKEVATSKEVI